MSEFIKINNNTIVNLNAIYTIIRYSINNISYEEWQNMYSGLLRDVSEQYMKLHADEINLEEDDIEIADKLYAKFESVVRRNVEEELGPQPEPFTFAYKIVLGNSQEVDITEETYNMLCNKIGIDMNNDKYHDDI